MTTFKKNKNNVTLQKHMENNNIRSQKQEVNNN